MRTFIGLVAVSLLASAGCQREEDETKAREAKTEPVRETTRDVATKARIESPKAPRAEVVKETPPGVVKKGSEVMLKKATDDVVTKAEVTKSIAGGTEKTVVPSGMKMLDERPPLTQAEYEKNYNEVPRGVLFCTKDQHFYFFLDSHLVHMNHRTGRWFPGYAKEGIR